MADCQIEVAYQSRGMSIGCSSAQQTIVVGFTINENDIDSINNLYLFKGFKDDTAALAEAYTNLILPESRVLPDRQGDPVVLLLTNISLKQVSVFQWEATGTYTYDKERGIGGSDFGSGEISLPYVKINFSVGGGTKTITKSLGVPTAVRTNISPTIPAVPAIATQGGIGVSSTEVSGTEVPDAQLTLQITGYFLPSAVNNGAYMSEVLTIMTGTQNYGTVNAEKFFDFEVGEVSLIDCSSGSQICNIQPITFTFSIKRNIPADTTDEAFPAFTATWGHDLIEYLWFSEADTAAKKILARPQVRVIHKVRTVEDYTALGLPNLNTNPNGFCTYTWTSGAWAQTSTSCVAGYVCDVPTEDGTFEGQVSPDIPCIPQP